MNTVFLVVDRLHVGYLGTYGNAWIETPALDRLAAQAFVFDQFLIDSPRLDSLYQSYWQGRHALCGADLPGNRSLPSLLAEAGVTTALLTDEPEVADHPLASEFAEILEFAAPDSPQTADQVDQTHLAQCFAQLIERMESTRGPFLLWCHLTGLGGPWDAPLEFRQHYVEPGDPPPPDFVEVPSEMLAEGFDPDHVLGISQAYAGQVSLLDTCLGALLESLQTLPAGRETLLVLLSARGFPLGEHRRIGPCDDALYGELVHVPLFVRFPDLLGACARSQALVQPADLWLTILEWSGIPQAGGLPIGKSLLPIIREEAELVRDRLCVVGGDGQRAIRTPAWYLRDGGSPELFKKPDDRWEVNEVSNRCPGVVESLQRALTQYEQIARSGQISDPPPLDETLLIGIE
jgi:arylsulfatase A-like enzyme